MLKPESEFREHLYDNPDSQVPGKSRNGESESYPFQFRGPAWVHREIQKLIESKKFPHLETASDLMRQAVISEVEYLISVGYVPTSVWGQSRIMDELNSQKRAELKFHKVAQDFNENIMVYWREGEKGECRQLLARFRSYVASMPECHFKRKWKKELKKYDYIDRDTSPEER